MSFPFCAIFRDLVAVMAGVSSRAIRNLLSARSRPTPKAYEALLLLAADHPRAALHDDVADHLAACMRAAQPVPLAICVPPKSLG